MNLLNAAASVRSAFGIDPRSIASVRISPVLGGAELGHATGFLVEHDGYRFLITNYHVVSGLRPDNNERIYLSPDRLLMAVPRASQPLRWAPHVQALVDDDSDALWFTHPTRGREFDVVALALDLPPELLALCYPLSGYQGLALEVGARANIIGFPHGLSGPGLTGVWKSGNVASEPELFPDENPYFWVEAPAKEGMSGSPVFLDSSNGIAKMDNGDVAHFAGPEVVFRPIGVFAGRNGYDLGLCRVWRWLELEVLVRYAAGECRKGLRFPVASGLHHSSPTRERGIWVENRSQIMRTADGSWIRMSIADLISAFALSDDRFGRDLLSLGESARIAAACRVGKVDGAFELTASQHAAIRAVLENPSNPYNARIAVKILPLLEYFVSLN